MAGTHRKPRGNRRSRLERTPTRKWIRRILLALIVLLLGRELWLLAGVARLRSENPDTTAMMDERSRELQGDFLVHQQWRPLTEISPRLVRAVIASEDLRFSEHGGIDYDAVRAAFHANRAEGRVVQGGSTITQQLAKNLFLSSRQSYARKAREAVFAYELELLVGKRRIMELYLNVIEWGDGIYGAEAAAQHYFGRPAARLTTHQAAYLAAIIPGPREALNPRKHPKRHYEAQKRIQRAMRLVEVPTLL